MKTFIYLIFTCLISTCAFYGALNLKNPFPCFAVAFGVWALFLWALNRRMKKHAARRFRERLFEDYMRSNISNRIRF
ncbi:MAG: hypothetical protein ACTHJ8_13110 [Mucilaginibacter sp.]